MQHAIDLPALPEIPGARIAIVQGRWYHEHTDTMVEHALSVLAQAGVEAVDRHVVPGCYEIPLACATIARLGGLEAIIAIGAVIKGETHHFDQIVDHVTHGLLRVALDHDVPILNEVLGCAGVEQLIARSGDDAFNKGIEAAVAAVEMIAWRRSVLP